MTLRYQLFKLPGNFKEFIKLANNNVNLIIQAGVYECGANDDGYKSLQPQGILILKSTRKNGFSVTYKIKPSLQTEDYALGVDMNGKLNYNSFSQALKKQAKAYHEKLSSQGLEVFIEDKDRINEILTKMREYPEDY